MQGLHRDKNAKNGSATGKPSQRPPRRRETAPRRHPLWLPGPGETGGRRPTARAGAERRNWPVSGSPGAGPGVARNLRPVGGRCGRDCRAHRRGPAKKGIGWERRPHGCDIWRGGCSRRPQSCWGRQHARPEPRGARQPPRKARHREIGGSEIPSAPAKCDAPPDRAPPAPPARSSHLPAASCRARAPAHLGWPSAARARWRKPRGSSQLRPASPFLPSPTNLHFSSG